MRILLDESLPRNLAMLITGHETVTVQAAGWSSIKNGELLAMAATQFDVFPTADRNIEFQQNLNALPVAIVVLRARNNRIQALQPLLPELL
jgi:predicted nuclease of predicted toxin-antitoxin system